MIVKPAIIPNIFVEYIFCSPEKIGEFVIIAGKLSTDESVTIIGKANERIIQGKATHHNKDGLIIKYHFFTKIRGI